MIIFTRIAWANLLSTGNTPTEIRLDAVPHTLILGENGVGKSTILDALTFALFGKPFRNVNKPLLVNSINGGGTFVEVEFTVGPNSYRIRRGIKPNTLDVYLNGVALSAMNDMQKYIEEYILRLNYKAFTQVIILGSATFVPFMRLPTSHRREIIEDILDIEVFSVMANLVKDDLSQCRDRIVHLQTQRELVTEQERLATEYTEKLAESRQQQIVTLNTKIVLEQQKADTADDTIKGLGISINQLTAQIKDLDDKLLPRRKWREIATKLNVKMTSLKNALSFYQTNDHCPTCKQEITAEFKTAAIDERNKSIDEVEKGQSEVSKKLTTFESIDTERAAASQALSDYLVHLAAERAIRSAAESQVESLQQERAALQNQEVVCVTKTPTEDFAAKRQEITDKLVAESRNKTVYERALDVLKDSGIKAKVIRYYLPIINKLVNQYLAAMDFPIQLFFDEQFNETIKSRYRDDFVYNLFSEGEKKRIDLALLLTWRAVARLKNSASSNLLILDEVFDSSLDNNGTEEFLKLVQAMEDDTNVFIISHKNDQLADKFPSVLRFVKVKGFSQLQADN